MSHNEVRDHRKGGRGTVEARRRRRMRPTLMALEDRRLLSTFTVTSTLDDGSVGTLRWAVGQANSAGGAETVNFDKQVFKTPQTITLLGTQLELSDTTGTETITGPKADVTVSGGGASRVFQVDGGVTANFSGLTIMGGTTANAGGGLNVNGGTATLTNCTISGNSSGVGSSYGGYGGGLSNKGGNVTLKDCTISGNTVEDGSGGGGLATLTGGTTELTDCTISDNAAIARTLAAGGGLIEFGANAQTKLTHCTISGNFAASSGGGLATYSSDTAILTDCTIRGNSAGGGSRGGGGVSSLYGTTTLNGCTVSGNSAANGGGVDLLGGTNTLNGCKISGNSATGLGGGEAPRRHEHAEWLQHQW